MIVRELNSLIREANYLFVLLPVVNFVYIYSIAPTRQLLLVTIFSCLISAFFFNFTKGYPEESGESAIPDVAGYAYILSVIFWALLWAYSLFLLFGYVGFSDLLSNVLFIGSVAWAAMLITHYLLSYWVDSYDNDIYDIK